MSADPERARDRGTPALSFLVRHRFVQHGRRGAHAHREIALRIEFEFGSLRKPKLNAPRKRMRRRDEIEFHLRCRPVIEQVDPRVHLGIAHRAEGRRARDPARRVAPKKIIDLAFPHFFSARPAGPILCHNLHPDRAGALRQDCLTVGQEQRIVARPRNVTDVSLRLPPVLLESRGEAGQAGLAWRNLRKPAGPSKKPHTYNLDGKMKSMHSASSESDVQ
jgi:hypothetical protein